MENVQLRVNGPWSTWNFSNRSRGPIVPAGEYPGKRFVAVSTDRAAIVLDNPSIVGGDVSDLIGEDEEHMISQKIVDIIA